MLVSELINENTPKLPSRHELLAQGAPFGKIHPLIPLGDPKEEWRRTDPDILLYTPGDRGTNHSDNCVIGMTPTADDKELLAFWTTSSVEAHGDNRIVMARSEDGTHWTEPKYLLGAQKEGDMQSSWAMPMLTKRGRIYLFYIQETEHGDRRPRVDSGIPALIYSDDQGHTWSQPGYPYLERTSHDADDPTLNKNWTTWNRPVRDAKGRFIMGFTAYQSPTKRFGDIIYPDSPVFASILRFENLEDHPEPADVKLSILPKEGLKYPHRTRPELSLTMELSPVLLPDGRLFAAIRTLAGCVCYSVSDDGGDTWRDPLPIHLSDGSVASHPFGPAPMFRLEDGRYILFFNNNDGHRTLDDTFETDQYHGSMPFAVIRNPVYLSVGVFDPNAEQPIRFGMPVKILDTDDIAVCPKKQTVADSLYGDVTEWGGKRILWYPDRKFYLLGKELPNALLDPITP